MADLDSQWEFSTWISRASVFLQLDDTGSTGMTIHRRTREEKTIYRSVTKVSRANSASLPPGRITNDSHIYIYIYMTGFMKTLLKAYGHVFGKSVRYCT